MKLNECVCNENCLLLIMLLNFNVFVHVFGFANVWYCTCGVNDLYSVMQDLYYSWTSECVFGRKKMKNEGRKVCKPV